MADRKIDFEKLKSETKKAITEANAIKDMTLHSSGWKVLKSWLDAQKEAIKENWRNCKTFEEIKSLDEILKFIETIDTFIKTKVSYADKSKSVLDKKQNI